MPIRGDERGWILEMARTAYALGLNTGGLLVHRYWGPRLPYPGDYPAAPEGREWASFDPAQQVTPEEYPASGGMRFIDPCLKVTFADGVRDLALRFERADTDGDELRLLLRDTSYPLTVTLHYRLHTAHELLERWATLRNEGDEPMLVERAFSAQWHLPPGDGYRLTHLTGRWSDEFHLRRQQLQPGLVVLESRRLTTSHQHCPWFAVDDGTATEDHGAVYFGTLAWSGNWKISAEVTDFGSTRLNIGLNDWDFAYRLLPDVELATPPSYAGCSDGGFGGASRALHDLVRDQLLPHGQDLHKVLYNSWEATEFRVDLASQVALARRAAALGVELFVLDDGWFHQRTSDSAGLGDWWADAAKFPQGLAPLIAEVRGLGMDFGLWIEPEMVNPDSDLYRAHPDWVIHYPTRHRTLARGQMILNLARVEVQDHLIAALDRLLTGDDIRFIKWDMNRNVSEPGWQGAPGDPRELWVAYVEGLYRVWGTLRARHPRVTWQSCSGGGGRADFAILRLADQIWISDNTDATARLGIQEGFSQLFPAASMEAWVTDAARAKLSLTFRFHVSMCGVLGIGGNLLTWGEDELSEAAALVAQYKEIRHLVQRGDQYRLRSPQQHAYSAVQYLAKDGSEGVLFVFRTHLPHLPHTPQLPALRLRGLQPEARYRIDGQQSARSGAAWAAIGLQVPLGDFESAMLRIRRGD